MPNKRPNNNNTSVFCFDGYCCVENVMRGVNVSEEIEQIEFAKRAAKHFSDNQRHYTFSDGGDIMPGCLLAMRWGLGDDCVLVMKLDDYHVPTNYHQLIEKKPTASPDFADALAYGVSSFIFDPGRVEVNKNTVWQVTKNSLMNTVSKDDRTKRLDEAHEEAKKICGFAERAAAAFLSNEHCVHWCDSIAGRIKYGTEPLNALRDGNDVLVVDRTNNKVTRMDKMINIPGAGG